LNIEEIYTVNDLIEYYLSNAPNDILKFYWDNYLGIKYYSKKELKELRETNEISFEGSELIASNNMFQSDYHTIYFRLRLLYEIRSTNRLQSTEKEPVEPDDVQSFIKALTKHSYEFLDGKPHNGEQDLMSHLFKCYRRGLQLLGEVKTMASMELIQEVWQHYIKEWDLEFKKKWQTPQEEYEAINVQKELLWLAHRWCTTKYTQQRVWLEKYIGSFKNPMQLEKEKTIRPTINSMKWISSTSIEKALEVLQPLNYLMKDVSLEGLKMAFGGGNIYDIEGCITPSPKNKEKLLFLIYNLIKNDCVEESENMEWTIQILTNSNVSYRRYKSSFKNEDYSIPYHKENIILSLINTIIS
tara:strand:+ start:12796 stop:13863 length:1068 start_codon:yes stop_codon:yes gene_type:complete